MNRRPSTATALHLLLSVLLLAGIVQAAPASPTSQTAGLRPPPGSLAR